MNTVQEFLLIEEGGEVGIYGVGQLPPGTVVGRDARRIRVVGASPVRPPGPRLGVAEFDRWKHDLEDAGHALTIGPFWTRAAGPDSDEEGHDQERFVSLGDASDELLRRAEERGHPEDRRVAPVGPGHP